MMIETERFRVAPESPVDLRDWPTRDGDGLDEDAAKELVRELNGELEELQEKLYAEGEHRLLVVLQATDTGGKDSTIRSVFEGVNPQGVKVASFKHPTEAELAHDYLWRVHPHVPGNGEITIFNRSHYEDVLVVRVHNLVAEQRWRRRYHHIREFEQLLVDEGTTVLKFFLHISRDEQRERLQDRIDEPHKRWKFSRGDLAERERWDDYQAAYADMLSLTSTADAPWYVVPADRKWFRNLLVSQVLVDTLRGMDLQWPNPEDDLDGLVVE
ncbi:MAG: polyphosphate kinase 2 family protein [Acidimicrobiales bacterium]|nr:polyphosphate kinase 2 family protein [Acidimicrobiales bacterium]